MGLIFGGREVRFEIVFSWIYLCILLVGFFYFTTRPLWTGPYVSFIIIINIQNHFLLVCTVCTNIHEKNTTLSVQAKHARLYTEYSKKTAQCTAWLVRWRTEIKVIIFYMQRCENR